MADRVLPARESEFSIRHPMKNLITKSIVQTGAVLGLALLSLGSVRAADDAHLRMKGAEHLQHLNSPAHAAEAKSKREGKAECAHCEMGKKKGQGHSKAGRHTCHPCGADMDCGCHKAGHESKPNEPAHRH